MRKLAQKCWLLLACIVMPVTMLTQLPRCTSAAWVGQKLNSTVDKVNPFKGLVFYADADEQLKPSIESGALSLEFVEMPFSSIVRERGQYQWEVLESELNAVAGRGRHVILRFWSVYPGKKSGVPDYIKQSDSYKDLWEYSKSEKQDVNYDDWTSQLWRDFHSEFFRVFAEKYNGDKRIAFLQVGFGYWAEYHIFNNKYRYGQNFPGYDYQAKFLQFMHDTFNVTPWQISVDAADAEFFPSPVFLNTSLLRLGFGCFMDSVLAPLPDLMQNAAKAISLHYDDRMRIAPMGGEIAYHDQVQMMSLSHHGAFGVAIDDAIVDYHMTFALASDSLNDEYNREFGGRAEKLIRFKEVGMKMGYNFHVLAYHHDSERKTAHILVKNTGVAPAYYDMYVAVNSSRSSTSLKWLQPGDSTSCYVHNVSSESAGVLSIESDHLVEGQKIQFEAATTGEEVFVEVTPSQAVSVYAYFPWIRRVSTPAIILNTNSTRG